MEKKDGSGSEIIYHFDVVQHRIPLQQFIDTADTTKAILDDFNRQFFGGKLKYGLYVVPSEEGGLVEALEIILLSVGILGGGTAIMYGLGGFLDTSMGKFIYKKYTGEPLPWLKDTIDKNDTDHKRDEDKKPYKLDEDTEKLLVNCMANMPACFLSQDTATLANSNITIDNFPKAFEAKNKFYNTCIANEEVQGVAFDRSYDSWIKRERFEGLRVKIPKEVTDPEEYQYEIVQIVAHSPNWKPYGRDWEASYKKDKLIQFTIEDKSFWEHVQIRDIKPTIEDIMQVQWIYQPGKSKRKNVRVLNVISYNGKKISERLTLAELQKKCDDATILAKEIEDDKIANNTPSLFHDRLNSSKNDLEDDFEDDFED